MSNHFIYPKLPQQVKEIVTAVCSYKETDKTKSNPVHLLIPLDSGNGRTSITQTITEQYHDYKAINFSSRDLYLEFKLNGTVTNIYETDIAIQECAEYCNQFHGVVAMDIDALLPHLHDTAGSKFFDLILKIKSHCTLIIYTPSHCPQKQIDLMAAKIGVSLQPVPAVKISTSHMTKVFYENLPQQMQDAQPEKYENTIAEFISQNIPNPTLSAAIETAASMAFNTALCQKLLGKTIKLPKVV